MRRILVLAYLLSLPSGAIAALPTATLNQLGVVLPNDAHIPLDAVATDALGQTGSVRDYMQGHSSFVLFADYTCKNLCGPALVLLSSALQRSQISPDSYRVIVIGLDPKDTATDAQRMAASQMPREVRNSSALLLPNAQNLTAITTELGFRYQYDRSIDQFAHPEVVYAVNPDGRIARLLSPLSLTADDIRGAFVTSVNAPGPLAPSFRALCYRLGNLTGLHSIAVERLLKFASILTIATMAVAFGWMLRRGRVA